MSTLVARLPNDEREAFTLRSVQRLSLDEVSALLGVAVSTVSDRDRRARQRLRAWMREEDA
ncbi:MAG: sigma factor-like helix-turn-helix DNA-binding protein [Nannocystaceae bacterium]|nr:sigma-70 region 4 domain-containing protein [bacterium]